MVYLPMLWFCSLHLLYPCRAARCVKQKTDEAYPYHASSFFTARIQAAVRLSVCHTHSSFLSPNAVTKFEKWHPELAAWNIEVKWGVGWKKIAIFGQYLAISWKRYRYEIIIIIIITHISIAPWGPKIQRRLQQRRRTKSVWTGGFSSGAWMRERSRTVGCQQVKSSRRMGLRQRKRVEPVRYVSVGRPAVEPQMNAVGSRMFSFEPYHFRWQWVTVKVHFSTQKTLQSNLEKCCMHRPLAINNDRKLCPSERLYRKYYSRLLNSGSSSLINHKKW